MNAAREEFALVVLPGGDLFAIGGIDTNGSGGVHKSTEVYDAKTGAWSYGPSMLRPRQLAGAAVVDGKVYVVGGEPGSQVATHNMEASPSAHHSATPSAPFVCPSSARCTCATSLDTACLLHLQHIGDAEDAVQAVPHVSVPASTSVSVTVWRPPPTLTPLADTHPYHVPKHRSSTSRRRRGPSGRGSRGPGNRLASRPSGRRSTCVLRARTRTRRAGTLSV